MGFIAAQGPEIWSEVLADPNLPQPTILGSLIRPEDVCLPVGDDGMAVAYDVTVVSPVEELSLSSSARSVGSAADAAERRKAVYYANNCASQRIHFIPLAQTLGGWST
jgi:hypothetical protein